MPATDSNPPRRWVVLGAGGHAAAVLDVIAQRGDHVVAMAGAPDREWPHQLVASDEEGVALAAAEGASIALAVGDNVVRLALLELPGAAERAQPLQSPLSYVSATAALGRGVVVMSGAHIGPHAEVADGAVINTHAIVEHDCFVGAGTHVAPGAILLGASGTGARCLIGAGGVVLPGISIGDDVTVGAGSTVIRHVTGPARVAGNPSQLLGGDPA